MLTVKQSLESLSLAAPDNLPADLVTHLDSAQESAAKNVATVKLKYAVALDALVQQLRHAETPAVPSKSKLIRLRHIGGERSRLYAGHCACQSGCSHCCHLDTALPKSEAKLIAKSTGRTLSEPKEKLTIETINGRNSFFGQPCTFLVDGKCSIYANRPFVCRTLVNMDSVDHLCRLIPGISVPVPYLESTEMSAYFAYLTQSEQFADVREWFPATQ